MAENIRIGDVVRLKSGGPRMTVEEIEEDEIVTCTWFEKNELIRGTFKKLTLKISKDEQA